jgi:hypothetical protein
MTVERSSDKHGAVVDDVMKQEIEDLLRANRPTRAEPWHDPEPMEADDAPEEDDLIENRRLQEAGRTRPNRQAG